MTRVTHRRLVRFRNALWWRAMLIATGSGLLTCALTEHPPWRLLGWLGIWSGILSLAMSFSVFAHNSLLGPFFFLVSPLLILGGLLFFGG